MPGVAITVTRRPVAYAERAVFSRFSDSARVNPQVPAEHCCEVPGGDGASVNRGLRAHQAAPDRGRAERIEN